MEERYKHCECRNYAPIDVTKGICHSKKQMVAGDEEACDTFEKLPKCKYCQHYGTLDEEYIGTCNAEKTKPMAYPDLVSVTCEHFMWE